MPRITHDETKELYALIAENKERVARITHSYDQRTGKGVEGHDIAIYIHDYPIPTQWVTPEVANLRIYQDVQRLGGCAEYAAWISHERGAAVSQSDVINALFVARVAHDPAFAFATIFQIKHKLTGCMVPFTLNYAQRKLLQALEEMRTNGQPIRLVLLKARQWGGSTLVQLYIAWVQLFVKTGWYAVIVAQTKDTAKRIKAMYKKVLEGLPPFLFGTDAVIFSPYEHSASDSIITDRAGKILRDNVITIASFENFESTRGMDFAMAHYSEVAYWRTTLGKSAEQVITNIGANILEQPLTLEVMESTANGMSGLFYDEYQLAKSGQSARKAMFVPFFFIENDMIHFASAKERRDFARWLMENRDNQSNATDTTESGSYLWGLWQKGATLEHIAWYVRKRASFHDHASMASEAPSDDIECFQYSGHHVFDTAHISAMRERYRTPPILRGEIQPPQQGRGVRPSVYASENGGLWIWKHPNQLRTLNQYIVVVDAGGRSEGADYSVITVIDRYPILLSDGKLEVVARWRGHLRYDLLAMKAMYIAMRYKDALLVFESNTFDKKRAEASDYVEQGDHIRGILQRVGDCYRNLYMRTASNPEDIKNGVYKKIGFQTNRKTKQDMVDNFIVEFEDNRFIDHDERFYSEIAIYEQRPDGSYGNIPGRGNHDDILMTDMIGALVSADMPQPKLVTDEPLYPKRFKGTANESML